METNKQAGTARVIALCALLAAAPRAVAQDPNFQQFLSDACPTAIGALAERCGETFAGTGDVSAGSEASLNPSQFLAGNDGSLASSYGHGEDTRGASGPGEPGESATDMDVGPFGVSINASWLDESLGSGAGPARPYELTVKSARLGIDYRWNRRVVTGLWFGIEDSGLAFAADSTGALADAGRIDIRGVGGALFAGISSERGHSLDLGVGFTGNDHDIQRRALFEPVNPLVPDPPLTLVETRAETTGEDRWLSVNWSRSFSRPDFSIAPFAGLTWAQLELEGYAEQDLSQSGLAMRNDGLETRSLTATAGFDASRVYSTDVAVLVPRIRVGYTWEFDADATATSSRFLEDSSGTELVLRNREPDRDSLDLGAGIVAVFPRGHSLFFDLRSTIGLPDRDRYLVSLGWRAEL